MLNAKTHTCQLFCSFVNGMSFILHGQKCCVLCNTEQVISMRLGCCSLLRTRWMACVWVCALKHASTGIVGVWWLSRSNAFGWCSTYTHKHTPELPGKGGCVDEDADCDSHHERDTCTVQAVTCHSTTPRLRKKLCLWRKYCKRVLRANPSRHRKTFQANEGFWGVSRLQRWCLHLHRFIYRFPASCVELNGPSVLKAEYFLHMCRSLLIACGSI